MNCEKPVIISNHSTKIQSTRLVVPCGHCPSCLLEKRKQLIFRLLYEEKMHHFTTFATLTFLNEPLSNELATKCMQRYFKRLRRCYPNMRYYVVPERGDENNRLHYHALLFGINADEIDETLWHDGFSMYAKTSPARIAYIAGYTLKKMTVDEEADCLPPRLFSRNPGIGGQYATNPEMINYHLSEISRRYLRLPSGEVISMPQYYARKIYKNIESFPTYLPTVQDIDRLIIKKMSQKVTNAENAARVAQKKLKSINKKNYVKILSECFKTSTETVSF